MNAANRTAINAAEMIREVSPMLASMWLTNSFSRPSVVETLFRKMKQDGNDQAYRVRILLNRALEEMALYREAAQL
jgi:hypothetical protein